MPDPPVKDMWLTLASDAYTTAISFVDTNYRNQWENNIRHFNSKHHLGSKFNKASYLYKSRFFRPKTRSSIRSNEAAASAAFFNNQDVVSIEAFDDNDYFQVACAEFQEGMLQYRLTDTIPWYLICIGAFQDAQKVGVVVSCQDWEFEEKVIKTKVQKKDLLGKLMYENNEPLYETAEKRVTIKDGPTIRLVPTENALIHPAADWVDPVNSSPYFIEMIPMYVQDVKAKMKADNERLGRKKWKQLTDGEIAAARKQRYDSTRQTREGDRTDKMDHAGAGKLSDYDIVWVHRNIFKVEGEEIVFYTLGTEYLLSEPVFLEEEWHHGVRPYIMGTAVIETHKIYPGGVAQLGEGIQREINENVNARMENVKLVLNKRWFVSRGGSVDLQSLLRNVAGSVTMMNNINEDVKSEEFNDVTSSSYMEMDRLNVDYDELTGSFSTSSVMTNRKLNETVGGMSMLRGDATGMKEYLIKTFGETWVERVLKQLIMLERVYETNETLMKIAAGKSKMLQKVSKMVGMDLSSAEHLNKLFDQDLKTTVNVGQGATDPVTKINNFRLCVKSVTDIIREDQNGVLNIEEVAKEVFGRGGHKDGSRFLNTGEDGQDPKVMQLTQMVQELQKQLESNMDELRTKIMIAQIKEKGDTERDILGIRGDMAVQRLRNQGQLQIASRRASSAGSN